MVEKPTPSDMTAELGRFKLIPVVVIPDAEQALPLAEALLEGGLACAEITFRTEAAEEAIRKIEDNVPEMLLGAGTVITREQAERALGAGARFIVSPGFSPEVADYCRVNGTAYYPGVCTPSEVQMAMQRGLTALKFFPAEAAGGIKLLKAIAAPFPQVRFIPTGGISADNLPDYLALPQVLACGGSWMVKKQLIEAGRFEEITHRVTEAMRLVQ